MNFKNLKLKKLKSFLFAVIFAVFLLSPYLFALKSYAGDASSSSDSASSNSQIKNLEAKLNNLSNEINTLKKAKQKSSNSYFSSIQLLGTLAASYTYNFAKPNAYNANYGVNWQSDGFAVNYADITIRRSPGSASDPYGVGFHISFDAGQNIQFYEAYYGNPSYFTQPLQQRRPFDIRQAYININLPIGSGLDIHIGKEKELLGWEDFSLARNWNSTYSLLDNAEPSTYTGIFFTYNFIPSLQTTLGIANSQNTVVPIDNLPTIEFNAAYTPLSVITFNGGFVYGANSYLVTTGNTIYQDNINKSFYGYANAVYSPTADWSFVLERDAGLAGGINQSVLNSNGITPSQVLYPSLVLSDSSTYDKGYFNGTSFYIHHQQNYSIGQIAETFREAFAIDSNGLFEPSVTPGKSYTFVDSTLTLTYSPSNKMFKNMTFMLEFEHQRANHSMYPAGVNSYKRSQNTLNLMVLYKF
ncbi:MAG: outer membrane beta-barrel protein [bacterium]